MHPICPHQWHHYQLKLMKLLHSLWVNYINQKLLSLFSAEEKQEDTSVRSTIKHMLVCIVVCIFTSQSWSRILSKQYLQVVRILQEQCWLSSSNHVLNTRFVRCNITSKKPSNSFFHELILSTFFFFFLVLMDTLVFMKQKTNAIIKIPCVPSKD